MSNSHIQVLATTLQEMGVNVEGLDEPALIEIVINKLKTLHFIAKTTMHEDLLKSIMADRGGVLAAWDRTT